MDYTQSEKREFVGERPDESVWPGNPNSRNGIHAARGNAVTFLLASPSDRIRS
jgi:hypothetical protein